MPNPRSCPEGSSCLVLFEEFETLDDYAFAPQRQCATAPRGSAVGRLSPSSFRWAEGATRPCLRTRDDSSLPSCRIREPHAGKTYTAHGPTEMSHYEIAQAMGRAFGREVHYKPMTFEESAEEKLKGWPEFIRVLEKENGISG
jgi:uncharacterized protein YbjT (DUF2867 family)